MPTALEVLIKDGGISATFRSILARADNRCDHFTVKEAKNHIEALEERAEAHRKYLRDERNEYDATDSDIEQWRERRAW
jgi:CHASE1-domain containing sensor protein